MALDLFGCTRPPSTQHLAGISLFTALSTHRRSGLAFYLKETPDALAIDVQPTLKRMTVSTGEVLHTMMPGAKWVLSKELGIT